jgi:hypothetical protein
VTTATAAASDGLGATSTTSARVTLKPARRTRR